MLFCVFGHDEGEVIDLLPLKSGDQFIKGKLSPVRVIV